MSSPTTRFNSAFVWIVIIASLLGAFALWSTRLKQPYIGRHDNNTAWISLAAQNYHRFGYFSLYLGQALNADPQRDVPPNYYQDHPPLISLLVSFSFSLFGQHEASARLIPMFSTLLAMALLFRFTRIGFGTRVAWLTILLFATMPMIAYYGQMADHEEITVPILLALGLVYYQYIKYPGRRGLLLIAVLTFLAAWASWAAYFFIGALGLYALFFADTKRVPILATLMIITTIALASWIILSLAQSSHYFHNMMLAFLFRTGGGQQIEQVGWNGLVDFIWQMFWGRMRIRYTEALFMLALIGLIWLVRVRRNLTSDQHIIAGLIGVWLLTATLHIAVFAEGAMRHDYWSYYYAPVLSILGTLGMVFLYDRARQPGRIRRPLAIALLGVLIVALVISDIRWDRALYTERDPMPIDLAQFIKKQVSPGQPVYSNLPDWPAIAYYSQRDIIFDSQPGTEPDGGHRADCQVNTASSGLSPGSIKIDDWVCTFS